MGASNEEKPIVHKGAGHTAFGPADACLNGTYDNVALSSTIGGAASTKTFIENNPIAMVGTLWETSQSSGKVGVKSGTTQKAAVVTTGSKDVFIEGRPAARTEDPTTQNQGNSSGSVKPGTLAPSAESVEERAKKKCKLTSWEGTNGKAKLGYPGKDKTGQPNYLELWDSDTVTFTATRHDITKTPHEKNPKCELAPHTIWRAQGKVFPLYQRVETKEAKGTETFEVPSSLVVEQFAMSGMLSDIGNMDGASAMGKLATKFMTNDGDVRSEGGEKADGLGRQDYGGKEKGAADTRGDKPEKVFGSKFEGDPRAMMFFAYWWVMPPEIKVTATSCGGALDAVLKVFPNQKTKFKFSWDSPWKKSKTVDAAANQAVVDSLNAQKGLAERQAANAARAQSNAAAQQQAFEAQGQAAGNRASQIAGNMDGSATGRAASRQRRALETAERHKEQAYANAAEQYKRAQAALAKFNNATAQLNQILTALKTAEQALNVLHKISAVAGAPLTFDFAKDLSLEFEFSYERTKDRDSARGWRYYTDATMGQKWTAGLSSSTLLGVSWKAYFSLLQLAVPFIPLLAQALRRFRIFRVDLFMSVNFKVGLGVYGVKTEHDEFTVKGDVNLGFTPTIGAVMGGAGIDVVQMTAWVPSELKLSVNPPKSKGALVLVKPAFRATANYRAVIFPDRWWEIEASAGQIFGLHYHYNVSGEEYFELSLLPS